MMSFGELGVGGTGVMTSLGCVGASMMLREAVAIVETVVPLINPFQGFRVTCASTIIAAEGIALPKTHEAHIRYLAQTECDP
jgi:hypothetical protein